MAKVKCEVCNRNFKNEEALQLHSQVKHSQLCGTQESKKPGASPKTKIYIVSVLVAIVIIVVLFSLFRGSSGNYDSFAQCLTDSGAKMYGAYWCPHCQDQKALFGSSWKYVNYIECSLPNRGGQTEECNIAGIQGYPTWEFADGRRIESTISLEQLSQLTNCPLTESN